MTPGAQSPETRHRAPGISARAWTALALLGGALIAVVLVAASQIIPEEPPEVWPDVAKAGVQIGLVGLRRPGSHGCSGAPPQHEARPVGSKRIDSASLVSLSTHTTASTRCAELFALGFRSPSGTGRLTTEQANEFLSEMRSLVSCQLALEHIKRELETRARASPRRNAFKLG
jgi:hypothetical protein